MKETVHDRLDMPNGSDPTAYEVWSNEQEDGKRPHVTLHIEAKDHDGWVYGDLTPNEARQLAAMLIRGAERIDGLLAKLKAA